MNCLWTLYTIYEWKYGWIRGMIKRHMYIIRTATIIKQKEKDYKSQNLYFEGKEKVSQVLSEG